MTFSPEKILYVSLKKLMNRKAEFLLQTYLFLNRDYSEIQTELIPQKSKMPSDSRKPRFRGAAKWWHEGNL